jgi:hypothetical protein
MTINTGISRINCSSSRICHYVRLYICYVSGHTNTTEGVQHQKLEENTPHHELSVACGLAVHKLNSRPCIKHFNMLKNSCTSTEVMSF